MTQPEQEQVAQRYRKLQEIVALGFDAYPHKFQRSATVAQIVDAYSQLSAEELERAEIRVRLAGRMMRQRIHGKASFAHISDGQSEIQIYVKFDSVGERLYQLFKLLDLGDFIGVEGELFRTKTGELTIHAFDLQFLAKALHPLPEKWHGLTDVETRYRQRYLDLLVNAGVRRVFETRAAIIKFLRSFLDRHGFIEVETPMMQPIAGGAAARPFITHHNTLDIDLYLRIAPELYLKRLVVGGFERVYELNRNFRNEGISTMHNPEFTMLEFYQAYSDYVDLMELTEEMMTGLVRELCKSTTVNYREETISFERPFRRFSFKQAIVEFWDRGAPQPSLGDLDCREKIVALLDRVGAQYDPRLGTGHLLGALFGEVVEEKLVQPAFIYDFPIELSPLAKRKKEDPETAERFELYIGGMEIANAYSELNDPDEQRRRFEEQLRERQLGHEEAHVMDEDYIRALNYGMPPTAGEGVGVDRLAMVLTNQRSIRDVILFPQLRPERKV